MHRVIKYCITETEQGLSINEYLRGKGFSSQNLLSLRKREGLVFIDDEPVFLNCRLSAGNELRIEILDENSSEKIPAVELPLDIVYEDEDLMVLNKPAGMPIHPSLNNYDNSLANALAYYFEKHNIPFVFRCITRLDRDTSGLVLVAKHSVAAAMLSAGLSCKNDPEKGIFREYLAIVRGEITPASGTIEAPIARKEGSIMERTVDFQKGDTAITRYRTLKTENGHSLVSLFLETGRTHQIRVHLKYIGFPLIGDFLYNPDKEYIDRQALHSCRLSFLHPLLGKRLEFTAPLPADMASIISL